MSADVIPYSTNILHSTLENSPSPTFLKTLLTNLTEAQPKSKMNFSEQSVGEDQFAVTCEGKETLSPTKMFINGEKINTQNQLLMNSLFEFYNIPENLHKMINIINGESNISLRIVDWFVTNYAKKYYTIYNLAYSLNNNECSRFKVYNDYKLKLKAYSKKRFDPFCRWERTMLPLQNNKYIETTIGQLNFFKWAIENQVIDYINENYEKIESDMNQRNTTSKKKQLNGRINTSISSVDSNVSTDTDISTDSENYSLLQFKENSQNTKTRKKREELSVSACKCIKKESVNIVVKFL
jgi:hypothetical protein